jgi:hypothetical protein
MIFYGVSNFYVFQQPPVYPTNTQATHIISLTHGPKENLIRVTRSSVSLLVSHGPSLVERAFFPQVPLPRSLLFSK